MSRQPGARPKYRWMPVAVLARYDDLLEQEAAGRLRFVNANDKALRRVVRIRANGDGRYAVRYEDGDTALLNKDVKLTIVDTTVEEPL